jgi:hypothetical protein
MLKWFGRKARPRALEVKLPDLDAEVAARWSDRPGSAASPAQPQPASPDTGLEFGFAGTRDCAPHSRARKLVGVLCGGVVVLACLLVPLLIGLNALGVRTIPPDTEGMGERILFGSTGQEEVYYTRGATEDEADRLGAFLVKTGFFDDGHAKTVQVARGDGRHIVAFVLAGRAWEDPAVVATFRELIPELSARVFGGAAVEIHLCRREVEMERGKYFLTVMKRLPEGGRSGAAGR